MESIIQDLRYALRTLVKDPAFAAVAISTLALGIGASTAIFSVVNAVLLAPLPYEDEDRLVMIWAEARARDLQNWPASTPDLLDYRAAQSFDEVASAFPFRVTLTGEGDPERVDAITVTENFLPILGARPLLGRTFNSEDVATFTPDPNDPDATPPPPAVILGHGLWQRRFGGDPTIVGKSVEMVGTSVNVVGVLPADLELLFPSTTRIPRRVDIWIANRVNFESTIRRNVSHYVLARLKPGITASQAQAEMDALGTRNRAEIPLYRDIEHYIHVVPLHDDLVAPVRPIVLALFGAVGFVLLIACTNVANLLLVRATTRSQEISIRAALGGTRTRIIRQMMSESFVLSLAGATIGLGLATAGIRVLSVLRPADLPRMETVGINGVVLAFTLLTSVVAAMIFGTLPALQASRTNLATALKTRTDAGGAALQRALRSGMVVVEVALSLVLLIGAGLMIRSFVALTRVDPGFNAAGVLTFQAAVPPGAFQGQEGRAAFFSQLRERIAGLPGVEAVGAGRPLPLSGVDLTARYGPEEALSDPRLFQQATYRIVTEGYFETMQTRLLEGRLFGPAEFADSLPYILVDDVLARKTWPDESAVGKRLIVRPFSFDPFPVEVIGVVENQRHMDLSRPGRETYYLSHRFANSPTNLMTWTVRSAVDPLSLVGAVRREVEEINPNIPLTDVQTLQSYVDTARAPTRFALILNAVFGATAMILAAVGLYGVLAYAVRQRTAEIGIRMAFGAPPGSILGLVVKHGMTLAVAGLSVGLAASFGLTRFITSLLVDVPATDPVTYASMVAFFLVIAALASYIPALRATRVDPMVALREE